MTNAWFEPTDAERAAIKPWGLLYLIASGVMMFTVIGLAGLALYEWRSGKLADEMRLLWLGPALLIYLIISRVYFHKLRKTRDITFAGWYWLSELVGIAFLYVILLLMFVQF